MFVTGARIGEIVALKYGDFEGNTFKIRRTETRFTDSEGKYVCEVKEFPKSQAGVGTVIIPEDYAWVTKAVQRQNPFEEFIFVKDGYRISTQAMRVRLKRKGYARSSISIINRHTRYGRPMVQYF